MTIHTACYRRGEMTKSKYFLYHRSMSISLQYLSKNTRFKSIYSLRHPAQLCKEEERTTLLIDALTI